MAVELFFEETQLQGFILYFKQNGLRLSPFSPELTSEERDLYRRSKNYGDVNQALVDYLINTSPNHFIHFKTKLYSGQLMWDPLTNFNVKLVLDLSAEKVTLRFQMDSGRAVVFLTNQLIVSLETQQLLYYDDRDKFLDGLREKIQKQWQLNQLGDFFQDKPLLCSAEEWSRLSLCLNHELNESDQVTFKLGFQVTYDDAKIVNLMLVTVSSNDTQFSIKALLDPIFQCCPIPLRGTPIFFQVLVLTITDQFLFKPLNLNLLSDEDETQLNLIRQWHDNVSAYLSQNIYLVSVDEGNWVVGQLDLMELMTAFYFLWSLMQDLSLVSLQTLSFNKDDFHRILVNLEQGCQDYGYALYFLKEKVETEQFDISLKGELDPNHSIWDQIYIQGRQVTDDDMARFRMSDWVVRQSDKTVIITPEVQKKIDALFMTERLLTSSQKQTVNVPYRVTDMIYYLGLYQADIKEGIPVKYRERIDHLLQVDDIDIVPLPRHLLLTPRSYQVDGYRWIIDRYRYELGAVLADEMGLGKTIQAIMVILAVFEAIIDPHLKLPKILIVVPPSLLYNWLAEVRLVSDQINPVIYFGSDRNADQLMDAPLVITTYDIVRLDLEKFKLIFYEMVVFDEVQWVKNIKAGRAIAVRYLQRKFTLCLTGTPLENHVGDYYSILDLAIPGLLGDLATFQSLYQEYGDLWLTQRTQPFVLRRLKSTILTELPDKIEQTIPLDLSSFQRELYQGIVQKIQANYSGNKNQSSMQILTGILRLRQLCITTNLVVDDSKQDALSPKFSFLVQRLPDILDSQHSCLLYSQFSQVLDCLEPLFNDHGIPFLRIDGRVSTKQRHQIVNQFQTSDQPLVLMMTLKTGGVGLNLTRASYVIHLDPWWNPATEDQATDRAHRIGQTESVTVYKLVMKDSIEERVFELKKSKQALVSTILNQDISADMALKNLDLKTLVSLL